MNTDTISLKSNVVIQDFSKESYTHPNNIDIKAKKTNMRLNSKLTNISKKIKPETAIFTLIKLLVEYRDYIEIKNSVLTLNTNNMDLIEKLNYCMEFLAHIPFSFQYNEAQTKISLDFFHLEKEMNLINKLEIKNNY